MDRVIESCRAPHAVHMLSEFAQKIGFQEYLGAKTSDISSEETTGYTEGVTGLRTIRRVVGAFVMLSVFIISPKS